LDALQKELEFQVERLAIIKKYQSSEKDKKHLAGNNNSSLYAFSAFCKRVVQGFLSSSSGGGGTPFVLDRYINKGVNQVRAIDNEVALLNAHMEESRKKLIKVLANASELFCSNNNSSLYAFSAFCKRVVQGFLSIG